MSTLAEIQTQIAELQKKEKEIISAERKAVIEDIKAKLIAYNITVQELEKKEKTVRTKGTTPIKYRKSDSEYWVGRGPKPQWVKVIESNGENIELYRVPV